MFIFLRKYVWKILGFDRMHENKKNKKKRLIQKF